MKLTEPDLQQLEDFWQDRLEPADRAEIEKRLAEDPAYAEAAAAWRLIITEGFQPPEAERAELSAIRQRLQEYALVEEETEAPENDQEEKTKRPLLVRRWYLGLAAAAAVLLLLWFGPLRELLTSPSPYREFFAHLPRDNANLSTNIETGRQAYDRRDYRKAYSALLAEVTSGGDSLNLIYAGVAAIGSGQADQAIPLLEPLATAEQWRFYRAEIQWYLALAYLEEEEPAKATELLNALVQANSSYAEDAEALLEVIR